MGKPGSVVLTDKELESIHLASLNILENVGVYLPIKEVLDIVASKGAQVDYANNIAKFPSSVVKEFISKAPSEFTLYSRNPKFNMDLRPGGMYFGVGGGATRFVDVETEECREASLSDLEKLVRIADALDNSSLVGELVVPIDVPPELSLQYIWASALKNSRKHLMMYVSDADYVKDGVKMASAIVGGKEELAKKPIIDFMACIGQPLTYETRFLDGFVELAKHRIPILVHSGVMAGATGPVTLAGSLALSNAEILSGIAIAEMVNPGTPVVYSCWCRIFDMKAANVSISGPEYALFRMAAGQLVRRYYKVPIAQGGFSADAKILDVQAGYEQYIALISLLAETNLILGYQLDEGNITDPLSWVISDELAEGYLRIMKGFDVNDETLALDVIRSVGVGPGHNFLAMKHTHDHLREQHWLNYKVTERRSLSAWQRDGAKNIKQRARERLDEKLKAYHPEPLSTDVQKELDGIIKEAGERLKKTSIQ